MFKELNYYFLIIIEIIYISFSLSTFKNKKKNFENLNILRNSKPLLLKLKNQINIFKTLKRD